MARQLLSEKPFMVVVGDLSEYDKERPYYGILCSYGEIMKAKVIHMKSNDVFPTIPEDVGTVVYLAPEKDIRDMLSTVPTNVRFIGYVDCTEGIITSSNCTAYIGIPISRNYMRDIDYIQGMWEVVYPHITLAPPKTTDHWSEYSGMIGKSIHFKLENECTRTTNTVLNRAWIRNELYHVTRQVKDGKHPSCAAKEVNEIKKNVNEYLELVGYPVLM
jgi:hypothetical protein